MSAHGHVAIVTGAAQGLGLAISTTLLKEGYNVCLADVNEEKAKESLADLRILYGVDRVMYVTCDVSSEEQFNELFKKTLKDFGRVDVLVNNAGIANELNPKLMVDINMMGPINGCQAALKYMSKAEGGYGGAVVNISSIFGLMSYFKLPVYTATKHGVIGLTRSFGSEHYLNTTGITFMALCPYCVRTPLLTSTKPRDDCKSIDLSEFPEIIEPEFVAEGVLKLLEERQNGSTMTVLPGKFQYVGYPEELKDILIR